MINSLICLHCPNGCHLLIEERNALEVLVHGNKCAKGISFAHEALKKTGKPVPKIIQSEIKPKFDINLLMKVCAFWGFSIIKLHPGLMPAGSPERTLFRIVIEDIHGNLFVLEKIHPSLVKEKLQIINTLQYLYDKHLSGIIPYLRNVDGQSIQEFEDGFWQLVPFIGGEELNRKEYMFEGWRALPLAKFLIELHRCAQENSFYKADSTFSIKNYIAALTEQINKRHRELVLPVRKITSFLEASFFVVHDLLPVAFCHGDYHPMNMIWGKNDIKAVIDWEFSGVKPELYDLANMVGCLGIEHPLSLSRELVVSLVSRVYKAGIYEDSSWAHFLELVIALRFAWLSEWLRKKDVEMIDMELEYMNLLVDNRDHLLKQWGLLGV